MISHAAGIKVIQKLERCIDRFLTQYTLEGFETAGGIRNTLTHMA